MSRPWPLSQCSDTRLVETLLSLLTRQCALGGAESDLHQPRVQKMTWTFVMTPSVGVTNSHLHEQMLRRPAAKHVAKVMTMLRFEEETRTEEKKTNAIHSLYFQVPPPRRREGWSRTRQKEEGGNVMWWSPLLFLEWSCCPPSARPGGAASGGAAVPSLFASFLVGAAFSNETRSSPTITTVTERGGGWHQNPRERRIRTAAPPTCFGEQ